MPEVHLVVPGPLDQRTGGYLYDARMKRGLERLGWKVVVHNLEGAFPRGDPPAHASLSRALGAVPDGARVLLDGLAVGALPGPVREQKERLRLVALVHHPLADERGLTAAERTRLGGLEREALSACAGVIVTSASTAARLETYGVPGSRVRTASPGTDPARPAGGPEPGEPPCLLCVGSVIPRKGQKLLVSALARLRPLRWSCLCAGSLARSPSYVKQVLALVEEEGLVGRVEFLGECRGEDLDELYHRASLFVLPSHYEGYGMALAEALVRGLPVVSTTGGAIPETVPEAAGVLVPPGDDVALAGALQGLLSEPGGAARRAELSRAARRHGLELPGWDQAARACARAIMELSPDG